MFVQVFTNAGKNKAKQNGQVKQSNGESHSHTHGRAHTHTRLRCIEIVTENQFSQKLEMA